MGEPRDVILITPGKGVETQAWSCWKATHCVAVRRAVCYISRDFMQDISVKHHATRQRCVVCGDWPVPWKLCTTSSICVIFSTLALTRRAPQTPCIKSLICRYSDVWTSGVALGLDVIHSTRSVTVVSRTSAPLRKCLPPRPITTTFSQTQRSLYHIHLSRNQRNVTVVPKSVVRVPTWRSC